MSYGYCMSMCVVGLGHKRGMGDVSGGKADEARLLSARLLGACGCAEFAARSVMLRGSSIQRTRWMLMGKLSVIM